MSDTDANFLPPSRLIKEHNITARSLERWAGEGLVRTIPNPTRKGAKLYHAGDVARLVVATTTASKMEPEAPAPTTELLQPSELLAALIDTQRRLDAAMHEAGVWRGRFEQQQKLLEDREARHVADEAELERLRREVSERRRPWWLWWLRG